MPVNNQHTGMATKQLCRNEFTQESQLCSIHAAFSCCQSGQRKHLKSKRLYTL